MSNCNDEGITLFLTSVRVQSSLQWYFYWTDSKFNTCLHLW